MRPFWERYPSQYLKTKDGADAFSADYYATEEHDAHLKEEYFPIVAAMRRFPRYTNKRMMDPQLKCFVDEMKIEMLPGWGLPIPNQGAAYKSLSKYGKDVLPMSEQDVKDMNLAWTWTEKHFGVYMHTSRVVSLEEAISRLDMSSSTGAPFNLHYPTKKELFEKDPGIRAWLESDWERLAVDDNWTCICTNALKEEMRTDAKLEENSIRTFTAMPLDDTVHGTREFVDMNEKMYDSHLKTASAVGMSPLKGNWDRLYRKLKKFRKGYALDESQYDSSLRCYMMWGCAVLRWKMLRSEDQTAANLQRIKTLYRNFINTLILTPEGLLVLKKTGNPSGSCNTIADNTLILYTLLAYAWIKRSRGKEEMESYEAFEEETAKALVGDDNTWTVSDEAHEFYNAKTVISTWKDLGVTTTTDSMEPRCPEDLDFLSAQTVFLDGVAVPLYERAKLMNSLLYAPRKNITPATTLERTAAMLSIGWTDIPFRKFCREVIEWLLIKYDPILYDDPRWILAKCQIQTDAIYYRLFTGKRLAMRPQSVQYSELEERSNKPNKTPMNGVAKRSGRARNPSANKKRRAARRARNNRPNGPRGGATSAAGTRRPRMRKRNGGSRRKQGRRLRDGMIPGMVGPTATSRLRSRSCTVVEDEYVAEVISGATGADFNNLAYPINPGQAALFPWLSKQAAQWEKYHFNQLEFYYKPEVSQFATAGTTGKVIFGVEFDAADGPPTTKQAIEDTDPHTDCMPHQAMALHLKANEMHALYKTLYVRPGGLPGAADIKTYDAGNLNVATVAIAADTAKLGELRVKYSVTFSVPVLESAAGAPANNSMVVYSTATSSATEAGRFTTNVAYTMLLATVQGSLGSTNTAGSIVLPVGNYKYDWVVEFNDNAEDITQLQAQLYYGGVGQYFVQTQGNGDTLSAAELNGTGFLVSDGTSAVTLRIIPSFTGGAPHAAGILSFLAV